MKLWLATTSPEIAADAFSLGLFEGVLTNPTLIADAGRLVGPLLADLCAATPGPVFFQLRDGPREALQRQADRLLGLGLDNLGIKVALTQEGCAVLHWLREQKVALRLATAVPSVAALLLATALEVPWVTPSSSALERQGGPSRLALLEDMQTALDRQHADTVLIPSFSAPADLAAGGLLGLRAGFIWDRDLERFVSLPLVREIVAGFDPAWERIPSFDENGDGA
ncbi:MAG: hypothetical protein ACLFR7_00620 [Opitutales bacterium]